KVPPRSAWNFWLNFDQVHELVSRAPSNWYSPVKLKLRMMPVYRSGRSERRTYSPSDGFVSEASSGLLSSREARNRSVSRSLGSHCNTARPPSDSRVLELVMPVPMLST